MTPAGDAIPPPLHRSVAAALAVCLPLLLLWSLATPLMASPDEPAQFYAAAAAARGQLDGRTVPGPTGLREQIRLPENLVAVGSMVNCLARRPTATADCQPAPGRSTRPVGATTYFGNYPPLYFLVTGLPTLVLHGKAAGAGARGVSVLLSALLLALGAGLLRSYPPRGRPALGLAAAVTPMALALGAAVSNSGLEVSAAVAAWCGLLALADRAGDCPAPLAAGTAVAGGVLILSRNLSPGFFAVQCAAVAALAGWPAVRRLAGHRAARRAALACAGCGLAAAGWVLLAGTPHLQGRPPAHPFGPAAGVELTLRQTPDGLRQMVGTFGWLDTPAPPLTAWAWPLVVLALAVAVALGRGWRALAVAAGLVAAVVALPVAVQVPHLNQIGPFWQGRYSLPLAAGIPLVLARGLPATRRRAWWPPVLLGALAAAQVAAFAQQVRRYTVGLGGPLIPLHPRWQPAGGALPLLAAFAAVSLLGFATLARWPTPPRCSPRGSTSSSTCTRTARS